MNYKHTNTHKYIHCVLYLINWRRKRVANLYSTRLAHSMCMIFFVRYFALTFTLWMLMCLPLSFLLFSSSFFPFRIEKSTFSLKY